MTVKYSVWEVGAGELGDVKVFEGTLEECLEDIHGDIFDEFYIVEPDGFTVYEG